MQISGFSDVITEREQTHLSWDGAVKWAFLHFLREDDTFAFRFIMSTERGGTNKESEKGTPRIKLQLRVQKHHSRTDKSGTKGHFSLIFDNKQALNTKN